ncbi:helix-turn-helix transcriptional regulator [Paenibacillus mesophilus]|uniref:helix-turn-helix transcriptional regulator n=1 Tax=Paenibacillus mesophilus TaxID=2582849 RepID=UPI00110EF6E3|nr:helix-turn-helix transcriptional regulator [Paenibacillus mesophilus]TMV49332.1 helix-turn-helix transcriptional regulator [Paenibacillus mesophilus]
MLKSKLKVILAERNMQQQDLLKLMTYPVANSTMSNIVNGTIPKLETASDIAKALGMRIEEIWVFETE